MRTVPIEHHEFSGYQDSRQIAYEPICAKFQIRPNWELKIKKHLSRSDESDWSTILLRDYWLPPSMLSVQPRRLTDEPELCIALCKILDFHLLKQSGSKKAHDLARSQLSTYVKFIEYCWINEIYRLEDWPEKMWDAFLEKYRRGGWVVALELESRTKILLSSLSTDEVSDLSHWAKGKVGLNARFCAKLGTNAAHYELDFVRLMVMAARTGKPMPVWKDVQVSFSALARVCTHLSSMANVPPPYGITSVPTENPYLYAKNHGTPQSRTRSMTPDDLATLLVESYRWVHDYGPHIVKMAHALKVRLPRIESSQSQNCVFHAMADTVPC